MVPKQMRLSQLTLRFQLKSEQFYLLKTNPSLLNFLAKIALENWTFA